MYIRKNSEEYKERIKILKQQFIGTDKEFNYAMNNTCTIQKFKCPKCNGIYSIVFKYRLYSAQNCPYCAGKRILKGYNDLASKFPYLLDEWDYDKNEFKPDEILAGTDKIVYWKCINGHRWSTPCSYRTVSGNGCPYCNNNQTSFPEQIIYNAFKLRYNALNRKKINGVEFDIVIPELKLCIEYDGQYWHSIGKHLNKQDIANENGYRFLNIIEDNISKSEFYSEVTRIDNTCAIIHCSQLRRRVNRAVELLNIINIVLKQWYNVEIQFNISKIQKVLAASSTKILENSIYNKFPELMEEWSEENLIDPRTVSKGSDKIIKWRCKNCGNTWEAYISSRTNIKSGCPDCAKKLRAITRRFNMINKYPISNEDKQILFNNYLQEKKYPKYILDTWLNNRKSNL